MNYRLNLFAGALTSAFLCIGLTQPTFAGNGNKIEAKDDGKTVTVNFKGDLVTQFHYKGFPKPIFYPVVGPHGIRMTRNYPMRKGFEGEASDHPHHQSLWFTHGDVNGISFWHRGDDAGHILNDGGVDLSVTHDDQRATVTLTAKNKWVGPEGQTIATDDTEVTVHLFPSGQRAIDWRVTLHASNGELILGDTKEGTMGIRTHPALRLEGPVAKGKAVNSEGTKGKPIWGERAAWVDYWGPINGKTVGVAIFDHPSNPRHPTWWHARQYGLVAANPFGVHNFEGKPAGTGDFKIEAGQSETFRYRFLFHKGDVKEANIQQQYQKFAQ